jgi:broad specificity phosphatase PhoE
MRLLLIRHGQIQSNVDGVLDSAVPGPPLTELGREQAEALPEALDGELIGAIWVSSALRTQQTAAPLARRLRLRPTERDGIREIFAGDYESSTAREDARSYVRCVLAWAGGHLDVRIPGGENGHEFFARYDAVIEEALEDARRQGHPTVAIVSHGAAIRCWAAARTDNLGVDAISHLWLDNTGVAVLEEVGTGWTCRSWMGDPVTGLGVEAPAGPTGAPAE